MNKSFLSITTILCIVPMFLFGQQVEPTTARNITLHEAVDLAMKHNHVVKIMESAVLEKQSAKDIARSSYFPVVRNDTFTVHVTDTQFIEIPAGAFGVVGSKPIPSNPLVLNQGGINITTSGTGLVQPLTQLFKINAANNIARAEVDAARGKSRGVENDVALKTHQLYFKILVTEVQRSAVVAKIQASEDLQNERAQQVKYGSALDTDLLESRAQSLQSKQELLSVELQLSDLHMQFNDVVGLPLSTVLIFDPNVSEIKESCTKEECIELALESHPEITEAQAEVKKVESVVRLAKYEYIPDVEVFARYSFQNNVPFLAPNFGTFGIHFSYNFFDGGKKHATVREREAQLAQAKENLARITDEVELRVQTAYNKLERTRQVVAVSEELLALRTETRRVLAEQLAQGSVLSSQSQMALAQELEAKALLLQSQLDYFQAADEVNQAIGRKPE